MADPTPFEPDALRQFFYEQITSKINALQTVDERIIFEQALLITQPIYDRNGNPSINPAQSVEDATDLVFGNQQTYEQQLISWAEAQGYTVNTDTDTKGNKILSHDKVALPQMNANDIEMCLREAIFDSMNNKLEPLLYVSSYDRESNQRIKTPQAADMIKIQLDSYNNEWFDRSYEAHLPEYTEIKTSGYQDVHDLLYQEHCYRHYENTAREAIRLLEEHYPGQYTDEIQDARRNFEQWKDYYNMYDTYRAKRIGEQAVDDKTRAMLSPDPDAETVNYERIALEFKAQSARDIEAGGCRGIS